MGFPPQTRGFGAKPHPERGIKMGPIELISAILLILSCIFIIIIVFFQGANKGGMSQTITGQSSDNYYQRNSGRSKEMRMKRLTVIAAVIFFVVEGPKGKSDFPVFAGGFDPVEVSVVVFVFSSQFV